MPTSRPSDLAHSRTDSTPDPYTHARILKTQPSPALAAAPDGSQRLAGVTSQNKTSGQLLVDQSSHLHRSRLLQNITSRKCYHLLLLFPP